MPRYNYPQLLSARPSERKLAVVTHNPANKEARMYEPEDLSALPHAQAQTARRYWNDDRAGCRAWLMKANRPFTQEDTPKIYNLNDWLEYCRIEWQARRFDKLIRRL